MAEPSGQWGNLLKIILGGSGERQPEVNTFNQRFPNMQGAPGYPYTIASMAGPLMYPSEPGTIQQQFGGTPERREQAARLAIALQQMASAKSRE